MMASRVKFAQQSGNTDTHGFIIAANLLELGRQRLETALTDAQLVQGHLQLALHLVVVGLQFLKSKTTQLACAATIRTVGHGCREWFVLRSE